MACYTTRTETKVTRVYTLPLPSNMTEVSKLMSGIIQEFKSNSREMWDDSVTVTANEDELCFTFSMGI